jgi:hypothetical protein
MNITDEMKRTFLNIFVDLFFLAGAVIIMMLPAIKNGYPFFYSDSASYILSGYQGVVPIDRPILYGLFVRHVSMLYSLWFVVFFQAAIFVGLMWLSFRIVKSNRLTSIYTFIACVLLGFFTGASNYISQIMPDVFSAFMIWSIALIFITSNSSVRWVLWTLALFSSMVHFSNLLTITVLVVILSGVILVLQKKIKYFRTIMIQFSGLLILPWMFLLFINHEYQKEYFINKSSNVFFTGRLIETGILEQYFEQYPESSQYSLFTHKGHLPQKSWQFAWNADSPLYDGDCIKDGWGTCWLVKSDEYGRMIYSTLSHSDLLLDFIQISLKDWMKQILDFEIGPLMHLGETPAFKEITTNYFDEGVIFTKSKQFQSDLFFKEESLIQHKFLIISVFILISIYLFVRKLGVNKTLLTVLSVVVLGLIVNALICSVFSGVLNRYQGRVIFLLPMVAIWTSVFYIESFLFKRLDAASIQNLVDK